MTVTFSPPEDPERITANPLGVYISGINWTAIHVPASNEGATP